MNSLVASRLLSWLFGIGILLTCLEKLSTIADYGPGGWHTWAVFRLDRSTRRVFRMFPNFTDLVFDRTGVAVAITLGIIGDFAMMLWPPQSLAFIGGVSTVFVASFVLNMRDVYGGDGSQQMNTLLGASLLIGCNPWASPAVRDVTLFFVAAQACLAYCTSGVAKLISPVWRRGDALGSIFATRSYGSNLGLQMVSYCPVVSRWLCRFTIGLEVLFPIALLGPRWVLIAALCWGLLFHTLNAFIMGLNTFFWAFVATYPALYYTWTKIHLSAK